LREEEEEGETVAVSDIAGKQIDNEFYIKYPR
jgi:hypothetical protein